MVRSGGGRAGSVTTSMWHRGGSSHVDVASTWLHAAEAAWQAGTVRSVHWMRHLGWLAGMTKTERTIRVRRTPENRRTRTSGGLACLARQTRTVTVLEALRLPV